MKSMVKLAICILMLLPGLSNGQAIQKSFNFVDKDLENVSGNGMARKTDQETRTLLITTSTLGALKIDGRVSLACVTRTKNKAIKTRENFLARLIHSNLAMTFRISRHMNLTISYI